jgi:hypothetical protein
MNTERYTSATAIKIMTLLPLFLITMQALAFNLKQGHKLHKLSDQLLNSLSTGRNYAIAVLCSVTF